MSTDYTTHFDLDDDIIYLNHAAVAPWPKRTETALINFAHENATIGSKKYTTWLKKELQLKKQLASLINAKSVYVLLSFAVTPILVGAGWLLNLIQNDESSSLAESSVSVPASISFL